MKKIIIILTIAILCIGLSGCGTKDKVKNYDYTGRFASLDIGYRIDEASYIVVEDTKTNILYLCSDNDLDLCVFLNPEGKPYTKDNFLNEYDRLKEK